MLRNLIVLVPFPFDGFSETKLRPALCLTDEIGKFKHVIIAFISSSTPKELIESDLVIIKGSKDWEGTGLVVDSVIRLHKIVTIPKNLLIRKLGSINKSVEKEVISKLKNLFEY
ncbi:MAG: growth inhibitor PemK [Bacteroidetes bacterium 4484_276]|nr:MAG: growth inhibitor PemK [Bacteroidetes bacterium 4484_276]